MKEQTTAHLLEISELIHRKRASTLSDEENQKLMDWMSATPSNQKLYDELMSDKFFDNTIHTIEGMDMQRAKLRVLQEVGFVKKRGFSRWSWVAASVILFLGIGAYFLSKTDVQQKIAEKEEVRQLDIPQGKSGAILVLADGSTMVLDSLGAGELAMQNGTHVVLTGDQLSYTTTGAATDQTAYNTLSTPKGRIFRLSLPDGSDVWLNAASSIRFPTAFTGNERRVEVSGEAYFEIAKNSRMPFKVSLANGSEVEVLGTSFNVSAYEDDETINTTLIEGSIKVAAGNTVLLKPGEQAQMQTSTDNESNNGQVSNRVEVIQNINLDKVMAWRNGAFNFENLSLSESMRQLERWYDIEVVIDKKISNEPHFFGEISKSMSLKSLLNLMSDTDLKFRIEEGRRLFITQ